MGVRRSVCARRQLEVGLRDAEARQRRELGAGCRTKAHERTLEVRGCRRSGRRTNGALSGSGVVRPPAGSAWGEAPRGLVANLRRGPVRRSVRARATRTGVLSCGTLLTAHLQGATATCQSCQRQETELLESPVNIMPRKPTCCGIWVERHRM